MIERHTNLYVIALDPEGHAKTCNYWYLVQATYGQAHTAFTERLHLLQWLEDRNLKLKGTLPPHGTHGGLFVDGEYFTNRTMDKEAFDRITPIVERRHLSNAEYTLAKITEHDGVRMVNYLNVNVPNRPHFDYQESRRMVG